MGGSREFCLLSCRVLSKHPSVFDCISPYLAVSPISCHIRHMHISPLTSDSRRDGGCWDRRRTRNSCHDGRRVAREGNVLVVARAHSRGARSRGPPHQHAHSSGLSCHANSISLKARIEECAAPWGVDGPFGDPTLQEHTCIRQPKGAVDSPGAALEAAASLRARRQAKSLAAGARKGARAARAAARRGGIRLYLVVSSRVSPISHSISLYPAPDTVKETGCKIHAMVLGRIMVHAHTGRGFWRCLGLALP